MSTLINVIFAWISVFLVFILSVIYILRKSGKKFRNERIQKINRKLRDRHKEVGIIFLATAIAHGVYSSYNIFSINFGSIAVVLGILLGATYGLRKVLKGRKSWIYYHRILTVLLIAVLHFHIIEIGGFIGIEGVRKALSPEAVASDELLMLEELDEIYSKGNYVFKDGVYQGEAVGYRPGLVVEVVIAEGKIFNVSVIAHNERNTRYYSRPVEEIPAFIILKQSPVVDTVSGSTFTSVGIMNAVINALNQSLENGAINQLQTPVPGFKK